MSNSSIFILSHILSASTIILGIAAVVWMIFKVISFNQIVMKIHYTASSRSYAHKFPLANFFDSRVLNENEKKIRNEGIVILSKFLPVFFIFGISVVAGVVITS